MAKETVKYIDGTTAEVEIFQLGFRKANQIAKSHIPINSLSIDKNTDQIELKGDIDFISISLSCLETIPGLDLDKLDEEEGYRLYKKYFEKGVMSCISGGNPN